MENNKDGESDASQSKKQQMIKENEELNEVVNEHDNIETETANTDKQSSKTTNE